MQSQRITLPKLCAHCGAEFTPHPRRAGRFCSRPCYFAGVKVGPAEFWARVNRNGPIPDVRPDLGPCWLWLGAVNADGYGVGSLHGEAMLAHRAAWKLDGRTLTPGLEIDHLCKVHPCVRPSHLEEVTHEENVRRGESPAALNAQATHCPKGHNDWRVRPSGWRDCRVCHRLRKQKR